MAQRFLAFAKLRGYLSGPIQIRVSPPENPERESVRDFAFSSQISAAGKGAKQIEKNLPGDDARKISDYAETERTCCGTSSFFGKIE